MGFVGKLKDHFRKYFITGLFVIIPIWATYYVLSAILGVIDGILADLPEYYLGARVPGMGIITLVLFVLLVGILSANYLGKRVVEYGDVLFKRVPLVRGVYTTVKQIMQTFSMEHNFHGVAVIEYPRKGCWSVGFVTGETQGEQIGREGRFVTVFVPTTPNPTAGFLLILPHAEVTLLNLTVEQGMKFIVSLGLVPLSELDAKKIIQEHGRS